MPTLNDQDLLSHKTPTLHFWLVHPQRPLHFLCLWIRMYNRVLHVMARYCHRACCIIGYFISLQAIARYCKVSHGIAQCCMVLSGHWVGCIIGRQFRQLALPQAGKQKTRPPPPLKSHFSRFNLTLTFSAADFSNFDDTLFILSLLAMFPLVSHFPSSLQSGELQHFVKIFHGQRYKLWSTQKRVSCELPCVGQQPSNQGGVANCVSTQLPCWSVQYNAMQCTMH